MFYLKSHQAAISGITKMYKKYSVLREPCLISFYKQILWLIGVEPKGPFQVMAYNW